MHIFITGVSSGIGWGLSKYYLSEGHQVYGLSRRIPEDLILDKNFNHIICDLTNFESISGVIKSLLSKVSKIDLAILNAGILGTIANMKDQSLDDLTKVMNINVWANKPVIDALLETVPNTKKVVAISSGAAINGNRGWGGYSISKAALNMFIKLYASENKNTAFYSFAPGLIDTPMQDYLCGEELNVNEFPSAQKLKDARYTSNMPTAENAGKILAKGINELDKLETGSFADIRKM
ncbi:MAG: alcohol dehydrogenase [Flavobacteriales bacterium]|nr:alcohol dehydrogenase [Flavobacteriales bacterium]|tara:strand:- start:2161 stop:2871 length:711 start_codon:yes stop_codon:yes gene_type:complete